MARKQSSTIWFQGNPHKEIYFQGNYHDKMYLGSQLIWEKLNDEFEKDMYYTIQDYSIYNGTTYFVGFLYKKGDVFQGTYIAKFNAEKMCLDMLHKIEVVSVYTHYLIHACKDGLVLIKHDYKFSEENTENQPDVGIAKYPIKQSSVFEKIGQNSFSEETTIFMPPFVQNGTYNKPQFMVFGKDYYVKQTLSKSQDSSGYIYGFSTFVKYSYDGKIIKETPADDTIITRPNNGLMYHNVFSINGNLITWIDELYYNGKSSSKAISYNNELSDKKKYSLEPPEGYRFSSLKGISSGVSGMYATKRSFALCNGNAYAIGQISTDSNPSKVTRAIFELSEEKMFVGVQIPVNALVDTLDTVENKLIVHISSSRTRCFYLIEDGEIKNQYDSYNTANAYAYDEENIYLWGGAYRYVFDKNLSYIKFEQEKIRIVK